jgi:hypothetical protein
MKDIRQELFWHPQFGVLERVEGQNDTYRVGSSTTVLFTEDPMETVYERDRRLWVEQLLNRKIADFTLSIDAFDTERWTVKAMAVYDKIQEVNFSFNQ